MRRTKSNIWIMNHFLKNLVRARKANAPIVNYRNRSHIPNLIEILVKYHLVQSYQVQKDNVSIALSVFTGTAQPALPFNTIEILSKPSRYQSVT
jgi:hypothetical protein